MSDFIYSTKQKDREKLEKELKKIYRNLDTPIISMEGKWGSLAFAENKYKGYSWFENEKYLFVIIGGPILKFSPKIEVDNNSSENSQAILEKWKHNEIRWENDLSGPYAIICINKKQKFIDIVTDMMSFVPVFIVKKNDAENESYIIGTHCDTVANISGKNGNVDNVSIIDLIINRTVVFPYTMYKDVTQLMPGSKYKFNYENLEVDSESYWKPHEKKKYKNINEAAKDLRKHIQQSVKAICRNVNEVGLFLSGGEDSRTIISSIPKNIKKSSYIFIDSANRESRIASTIAKVYNSKLTIGFRKPTHYLNNLNNVLVLVGAQDEWINVHSYGFSEKFKLQKYDVVLGGLKSDTYCKGFSVKNKDLGSKKFGSIQVIDRNYNYLEQFDKYKTIIDSNIIIEMKKRHESHLELIKSFRPTTSNEWVKFWPANMDHDMSNFSGNRRLFNSYEPFLDNDILKWSAAVPQEWKLNRKVFQKAVKPLLKDSWHIPHPKGHLPYFGYKSNIPIKFAFKILFKLKQSILKEKEINQEPWPTWNKFITEKEVTEKFEDTKQSLKFIKNIFKKEDWINGTDFNAYQLLMILQLSTYFKDINTIGDIKNYEEFEKIILDTKSTLINKLRAKNLDLNYKHQRIWVDINKCTSVYGYSFQEEGWHYLSSTMKQYLINENLDYQESYLYKYFYLFQPKNLAEALFNTDIEKYPELQKFKDPQNAPMPWTPITKLPNKYKTNYFDYGPKDALYIKKRFDRSIDLLKSIKEHGFYQEEFTDSSNHVKGFILKNEDDYRVVITSGNHRTAALSALGYKNIEVELSSSHPHIIDIKNIRNWPCVLLNIYPKELAKDIFLLYFNETGTEKAKKWGIL